MGTIEAVTMTAIYIVIISLLCDKIIVAYTHSVGLTNLRALVK